MTSLHYDDTRTTQIYTLSLHDALPIYCVFRDTAPTHVQGAQTPTAPRNPSNLGSSFLFDFQGRSEEHTSELQSHSDLVCRLLLDKKKHISSLRIRCVGALRYAVG